MKFFKKSLGQNLLVDLNIIKKITQLVKIQNKNVIEIGPGKGALTDEILKNKPKSLKIIEKDDKFYKFLKKKYSNLKFLQIYNEDILNFDLEKIIKKNSVVFGNLPYNISSQILVKVLKFKNWPSKSNDFIFMFQKELGEKIIGKFSSSHYGRLSILTNLRLKIKKKFLISPNSFFPKPKVTSMVIHFEPKNDSKFKIKDISNLEKITNILFSNKRKMINKNIKKLLDSRNINKIENLEIESRPADLKPDIYYKITELFEKK